MISEAALTLSMTMGSEKEQDVLFDCLETGFEQAFGEDAGDWDRKRVRSETQAVRDACLGDAFQVPEPELPTDR